MAIESMTLPDYSSLFKIIRAVHSQTNHKIIVSFSLQKQPSSQVPAPTCTGMGEGQLFFFLVFESGIRSPLENPLTILQSPS